MALPLKYTPHLGFLVAILGIIWLGMLLPHEKAVDMSEIPSQPQGALVKVSGLVSDLESRKGNAFFYLVDGVRVRAAGQMAELGEGMKIEALGRISTYRGMQEIVVEKVRRID